MKARYEKEGLRVVGLTRYYEEDMPHDREKEIIDSVWTAVYGDIGRIPIVLSTESMVRYGGSSTPTFVFVDRKGIVRRYTPTRLTEDEPDMTVRQLLP